MVHPMLKALVSQHGRLLVSGPPKQAGDVVQVNVVTMNVLTPRRCRRGHAVAGLVVAGLAVALAGCGTFDGGVGGAGQRGPRFAELDDPNNANPNASQNNIGSLTEVITRNPNDATAYNTRGAAYARAGRFNEAISDFNRAIQLDPNQPPDRAQ
jgi:cytochrome c-type biogenesis protein CcmH/NrfG